MGFARSATYALSVGGLALLASACVGDNTTEFTCSAVTNQQTSVSGDTVATTTGLRYRELTLGTGAAVESTSDCQFVEVQYVGRLADGTVFSETPAGSTFPFVLGQGQLIRGFEQGVVGMRVNGSRQLIIPPDLGYGDRDQRDSNGQVVIPANSTLIFDVTLVTLQTD